MITNKQSKIFKEMFKNDFSDTISDEEVEIRDNLYGLAEIAIESYIKERKIKAVKISE